jgi:hypothetical protein
MKPQNNKSLISFLFDQMDKLDNNIIDVNTAKAQADLAKQVNNSLKYELDRAKIQIEISKHNADFKTNFKLREAEPKLVDSNEQNN